MKAEKMCTGYLIVPAQRMATQSTHRSHRLSGKIKTRNRFGWRPSLEEVFHFNSPRERYQCDAAILHRLDLGFRKLMPRFCFQQVQQTAMSAAARLERRR
jgi:hypothetical protein